jgi:hypothetical protein
MIYTNHGYGNSADIELQTEKNQRLYEKFEIRYDTPVQQLEEEKELYEAERDILKQIRDDVRSAKISYITFKRKAIFGGLSDFERKDFKDKMEMIATKLDMMSETPAFDYRLQRNYRDLKNIDIDKLVNQYSNLSDSQRLDAYKENDNIQNVIGSLDVNARGRVVNINNKMSRLEMKLNRQTYRSERDKFNIKVDLSELEAFEEQAQFTLKYFNSSLNMKI